MKRNHVILLLIVVVALFLILIILYFLESKKSGKIIDDCGYSLIYNNIDSIESIKNHDYKWTQYLKNPPEECSKIRLKFDVRKTTGSAFGFIPSHLDVTFYKNPKKISRSAWIANAFNSYQIRYREYDKIQISFNNNMAIYKLLRDQGHNKIYDTYYFIFSPKNENIIEIKCEGGSEYRQGIPLCDENIDNLRFSDSGTSGTVDKVETEFFDSLQECNGNYQNFDVCYLLKLNQTLGE